MERRERAIAIYERLDEAYPDARCTLNFDSAWQLLLAAILAAQCTDERVNKVTAPLFAERPLLEDYLDLPAEILERAISSCGLYRNKAKAILASAELLAREFDGEVPSDMASLLRLPGVGRKIANLIRGDYFALGGVVVDTHCSRLARCLGLTDASRPEQIERDLSPLIPPEWQSRFGHLMVHHGRVCCEARHKACLRCPVQDLCAYAAAHRAELELLRIKGDFNAAC